MLDAFRRNYKNGMPYKQAGIILTQIAPENAIECDIFDTRDRKKDALLQQALDKVSSLYGQGRVRFAAQSPSEKREAVYNANNLSPRYTTRINEILTITC